MSETKTIKERTELREISDKNHPIEIWIKEQVWKENERIDGCRERRAYVFHLKDGEDIYEISTFYLSDLLHKVGHLLLAITNEEHHPKQEG